MSTFHLYDTSVDAWRVGIQWFRASLGTTHSPSAARIGNYLEHTQLSPLNWFTCGKRVYDKELRVNLLEIPQYTKLFSGSTGKVYFTSKDIKLFILCDQANLMRIHEKGSLRSRLGLKEKEFRPDPKQHRELLLTPDGCSRWLLDPDSISHMIQVLTEYSKGDIVGYVSQYECKCNDNSALNHPVFCIDDKSLEHVPMRSDSLAISNSEDIYLQAKREWKEIRKSNPDFPFPEEIDSALRLHYPSVVIQVLRDMMS